MSSVVSRTTRPPSNLNPYLYLYLYLDVDLVANVVVFVDLTRAVQEHDYDSVYV